MGDRLKPVELNRRDDDAKAGSKSRSRSRRRADAIAQARGRRRKPVSIALSSIPSWGGVSAKPIRLERQAKARSVTT